jgi:phosphopentomutase
VLGGEPISGTTVIDRYGEEHLATGKPIVYTSADSVFQIAAHDRVTDLKTLYDWCRIARDEICVGEHAVGRVIARPFTGAPGDFRRRSDKRRDYSLPPHAPALQQQLQAAGVRTVAVGKISDLFAGVGFDEVRKTTSNAEGVRETLDAVRSAGPDPTFVWTNLVDFDQDYGHRNDAPGFARALGAFDQALPEIERALADYAEEHGAARLVITADHGNDPTHPGTDHTRERVPLLVCDWPRVPPQSLGVRASFADHAAACAAFFGAPYGGDGAGF